MYLKTKELLQLGKGWMNKIQQKPLRLVSPNTRTKQNSELRRIGSKDMLKSSHKLQTTKSPSKEKIYPSFTTRHVSILNAQNSFTQLNNSEISVLRNQKGSFQQPFTDKSNYNNSPNNKERRFVRVNFINSSQNESRTSSSHIRQFKPSPIKVTKTTTQNQHPVYSMESKEIQTQRKLKILQSRIGELHKEKMQVVNEMNEQNRKLYHENTSLKLKICDLQKKIIRGSSSKQEIIIEESSKSSIHIQSQGTKIYELKTELKELQSLLKIQYQKNAQLSKQMEVFQDNYKSFQETINLVTKESEHFKELLNKKQEQMESYKESINKFQQSFLERNNEKQEYESQIDELKTILGKTLQKNEQVLVQYEQKLREYQNAYDHNQQIILQLTEQLQSQVEKPNGRVDNHREQIQTIQERQQEQNPMEFDCLVFENNLNNAITERDNSLKEKNKEIQELNQRLQSIESQNTQKQAQLNHLSSLNTSLQTQLAKLNGSMNVYNVKIEDMQAKYKELVGKYEQQRQKGHRSDGFNEKCKKCDQLMRTIFRLNNHLNSKKVS